jgi:hypothetical protein
VIPQSLEDMPKADQEIPPLPQHQEQQPEDQLPQEQQQELYQIAPQSQNQVLGLQWHLQNQHAAHERQIQLQQRSHDQIIIFKDNEISRLSMENKELREQVYSRNRPSNQPAPLMYQQHNNPHPNYQSPYLFNQQLIHHTQPQQSLPFNFNQAIIHHSNSSNTKRNIHRYNKSSNREIKSFNLSNKTATFSNFKIESERQVISQE